MVIFTIKLRSQYSHNSLDSNPREVCRTFLSALFSIKVGSLFAIRTADFDPNYVT
jgi:hypothetical protein